MDLSFCSKDLDENTKMLEQKTPTNDYMMYYSSFKKNAGMKILYPDLPSPSRGPAPR